MNIETAQWSRVSLAIARALEDPQTAHREALLELGGIEQMKESVHDVRAGRWIRLLSDIDPMVALQQE